MTLAGGSLEAAEDAVQEAFAQLCLHWGKVGAYDNLPAWIRRVAVNRLLDYRRALARRSRLLLRLEHFVSYEPQDELQATLVAGLRKLPERQRLALGLYHLAGLSIAEVADAMGVSESAVNQNLYRARKALKAMMEE